MKKLLALLLAMLMVFMIIPSVLGEAAEGETAEETTEEPTSESKVEQIMLKKGSAIIKEFIDCKEVELSSTANATFQSATITDVESGVKYYGIRIEFDYWTSKYDNGTAVALIDSDEIDSIISTLEYIKAHKSEFVDYTEVAYTSNGGFTVGAYTNSSETGLFFKSSTHQRLFSIGKLDSIIEGFKEAKEKIPQ